MAAIKPGKTFEFGPDNSCLGSITEPAGAPATMGVILFGMGVAEVMAARRFARQGFVAMQIRLVKEVETFNSLDKRVQVYDSQGVAGCRHAMDVLTSTRNIQHFTLMGNCAAANVSFNAGLHDQRVRALILTNPHVSEVQTANITYKRNLLRWKSWKRLLTGQTKSIGRLASFFATKMRPADKKKALESSAAQQKDTDLPLDFDKKLEHFLSRTDRCALFVFAHTEAGLPYIRKSFGKSIDRLVVSGKLWFEVTKSDSHVFSTDDQAAQALNEIITKWTQAMFVEPAGGLAATAAVIPAASHEPQSSQDGHINQTGIAAQAVGVLSRGSGYTTP